MTTNEQRILEIIWNWGGEASVDIIARETGGSIDYVRLICKCLNKESYIDFLHSKLCKIKGKGKMVVAQRRGQKSQKIVISNNKTEFGLGRDKRGKFIINYG